MSSLQKNLRRQKVFQLFVDFINGLLQNANTQTHSRAHLLNTHTHTSALTHRHAHTHTHIYMHTHACWHECKRTTLMTSLANQDIRFCRSSLSVSDMFIMELFPTVRSRIYLCLCHWGVAWRKPDSFYIFNSHLYSFISCIIRTKICEIEI